MTLRINSKRRTSGKQPKRRPALPEDWRDSIPDRPSRPRRLVNGRLQPVKNTASRGNARGRAVVAVKHTGDSRTLRLGRFDLRRAEGRKYSDTVSLLKAHLGGEVTAPQAILVDQSARLTVLTGIAWDELTKHGAFHDGEPTPALHAYLRLIGEARSVLVTLGLERRAKDVPDLQDYLAARNRKRLRLGRTLDAEDVKDT